MTASLNHYTRGDPDRDPTWYQDSLDTATPSHFYQSRLLGRYTVPAGQKARLKVLALAAGAPYSTIGIANGSQRNLGRGFLVINGTTVFEYRQHGTSVYIGGQAAEDASAFWMPWCQLWDFHDGIVIPAGQTIQIKVTPLEQAPTHWSGAIVGQEGGVLNSKKVNFTTTQTTADQVIFTYTPTTDYTLKHWRLEGIMIGSTIGFADVQVNGQVVMNIGRVGWDNGAEIFCNEQNTTYGRGAVFINTWGMDFYPGESIGHGFTALMNDTNGEVTSCIWTDETSLTAGAVYPIEDNVEVGVTYGPTGSDYTGTVTLPAVGDVRSGTTYGADGTEFTGTLSAGGGGNTYSRGRVVNR